MSDGIEISQQHNEDRLAGTLLNLQRGGSPPRMQVYDLPRAPSINDAPTATKIAEFIFNTPAGAIVAGELVLSLPPTAAILAEGNARWVRFLNGDGNASMDAWVGYPLSTAAVRFEEINGLQVGKRLRLTQAKIG